MKGGENEALFLNVEAVFDADGNVVDGEVVGLEPVPTGTEAESGFEFGPQVQIDENENPGG